MSGPLAVIDTALDRLNAGRWTYRQLDDLACNLYTSFNRYAAESDGFTGEAQFWFESVGVAFRRMTLWVQSGSERTPEKIVNREQTRVFIAILEEAKVKMGKFLFAAGLNDRIGPRDDRAIEGRGKARRLPPPG